MLHHFLVRNEIQRRESVCVFQITVPFLQVNQSMNIEFSFLNFKLIKIFYGLKLSELAYSLVVFKFKISFLNHVLNAAINTVSMAFFAWLLRACPFYEHSCPDTPTTLSWRARYPNPFYFTRWAGVFQLEYRNAHSAGNGFESLALVAVKSFEFSVESSNFNAMHSDICLC